MSDDRRYLALVDETALLGRLGDRAGGRARCVRHVASLRETSFRLHALELCAHLVGDDAFMSEEDGAYYRASVRESREVAEAAAREAAARERAADVVDLARRGALREEQERCFARCVERCHDQPNISLGGPPDPRCADASRACRRECGVD